MAEIEAKMPAANTIAMNMVPIASLFLKSLTVLDIRRTPTVSRDSSIFSKSLALILDVGRDSKRARAIVKIPRSGAAIIMYAM